MNKFDSNSSTSGVDKASRVAEAKKFFDVLYAHVAGDYFAHICTLGKKPHFAFFKVSDEKERARMAEAAISLDAKLNAKDKQGVYVSVNLQSSIPEKGRGSKDAYTLQVATVTDIDAVGGAHVNHVDEKTGKNIVYLPDFDTAKSLIPFQLSMLVNTGYGGLQGYAIYREPIVITADNHDSLEKRGENFIDCIQNRAGIYVNAVDNVQDIPRLLRVPGTRNCKVETDNAPMCRIVEVNDVRFSPKGLDEKISVFMPAPSPMNFTTTAQEKSSTMPTKDFSYRPKADLPPEFKKLRGDINANVTPEMLIAKGYLQPSPDGAVDKYCCVWCGSPHSDDGSAAMHYYEEGANSHFTCFSIAVIKANHGGDVFSLIVKVKNLDCNGANFFKSIKEIADEFSIPYDEKIFRSKRAVNNLPIDLVLPDGVEFQGNSIVLVGKKKKTDSEPPRYTASRTLIVPTKKFVSDGSGKVSYEVSIHLPDGTWKRAETDKRTLLDPSRIFELTEQDADVASPKTLTSYFSKLLALPENDALIPKVTVFNQPGWHGDNFIYPVPADGENYRVERSNINYASIFTPKGDSNKWLDKFLAIADADSKNQGSLKRIVIGACLVAPLLKVIGVKNIQINVCGSSSFAKTLIPKIGLSVYGDPSEGKMFRTWNSSENNRLAMALGFCDFPILVDEGESMNKATRGARATDAYNFFAGITDQKNKRNGDMREAGVFRGVRIMTSESPMHTVTDKQGMFKRLIDIPVREQLFDENTATRLHLFVEGNYGHFGRKWIQHVEAHKADIAKNFESACDYFAAEGFTRDGLPAELKSVDSTNARAVIACAVAFWHFYHCVFELPFDYMSARLDAEQILAELPTIDEMSDVTRSIHLLASWVSENTKRFMKQQKTPEGVPIKGKYWASESYAPTAGILYANESVAFYQNQFRQIVSEIGLPSYEKLLSDLYNADCLDCPNSGEKRKKVPNSEGGRTHAFVVKAGVLFPNDDD